MDFPNLLMAAPLFDRLQGLRLERIAWNGPVVALSFQAHRERERLLVHLQSSSQGIHLESGQAEDFDQIQFQDLRHDFSFLPAHLEGTTFLGGGPLRGQSLLRLDFSSSGNFKEDIPLSLYAEFFAGGRLVLADRDNRVVRASRKGGEQHRPGSHYWHGDGQMVEFGSELPLGDEFFADWPLPLLDRVRAGGEEPVPFELLKGVRGFSPESVRYLVERPRAHSRHAPEAVIRRRLQRWIERVLNRREPIHVVQFPPESPRGCRLYPFELDDGDRRGLAGGALEVIRFDDYVTALNYMGKRCLSRMQLTELAEAVQRRLEQRVTKNRRLQARLEEDWARAASAGDLRRQADTLATHLHEVKRGDELVQFEDVHEGGRQLSIPLDPARTVQENLSRLYKNAAKGERGLRTIELRLEEVRSRIMEDGELLAERLPALLNTSSNSADELAALRRELLELGAQTALVRARPRQADAAGDDGPALFRRYELPGGWQVLVGRNNRENDLLTHREASPQDIWLHASGVSGSHVILRTGGHRSGPPRSILEGAAAIAAFHSKARHSETVPVIYTEKRYVRKPRKGAPGLAMCTREKTLFVKPEAVGERPD